MLPDPSPTFRSLAFVAACWLGGVPSSAAEPVTLERMKYNHPGSTVDLGVGLWAWPLPVDYDRDGDLDLVVGCPDVPYNGTYLFENAGTPDGSGDRSAMPTFKPAVRIGPGLKNVAISHVNGEPRVLVPGHELTGFLDGDLDRRQQIFPESALVDRNRRIRANQWSYADFDGDGSEDIIVGHGTWADYGWDDAFDSDGNWTRGPLHGHVYWLRNRASTEKPDYAEPQQVHAGGEPVDVFGMPSPNLKDFDGDGDLDLLCGDFLDGFTYFQNVGTRTEPRFAGGKELIRDGRPLNMPLCMIVVSAIDWDNDGDVDLVVGQEDGRVALVEHTGEVRSGMPVFSEPRFFQQQADAVKFGALVTPVSFDWDGDGDEDLVCGNTAGEIGWIENLDGGDPPRWAKPVRLRAGDEVIRIMAGESGSIQGPAETKWGYTTIDVADWNHDGLPDIVANSIWGKVIWYRNVGTRRKPELATAEPIRVAWPSDPPKPAWNWWDPKDGQLVTQWRTTPCVADWDKDGLHDLVMLDHEGYLAWFRRVREGDSLRLLPGKRVFRGQSYDHRHDVRSDDTGPLRLNTGQAGRSGRRKFCIVDWDGDGRRDLLVNSENVDLLKQTDSESGTFVFNDAGPLSDRRLAGHTTSPTTVDWDDDGSRELLVGAEDGFFYYQTSPSLNRPESPNASATGDARGD